MKSFIISLAVAGLLTGLSFAGPNNGPQGQNHPQVQAPKINIVNQLKPNVINPVVSPKVLPNLVPNKVVAAPKKIDPKFKLTKFNNQNKFVANYNLLFGKSFAFGFFYPGKHHHHWSSYCWWPAYSCYVYWDPCLRIYYYWCEADQCFYPVCYATTVAPTLNVPVIEVNVTVNNNNTNDNSNSVTTTAPAATPAPTPEPVPATTTGAPVAVAATSPALLPVGFELPEPPAE